MEHAIDDWDNHWARFGSAAEVGPTPRYRRRLILGLLNLGSQTNVVEFGSGTGELAEDLLRRHPGCRFLGLEFSPVGVEVSRKRVPAATFFQRDLLLPVMDSDLPPTLATHAICSEVLEHLDNPALFLRNASRYMAPGCVLVATVPGGPLTEFYRVIGHRRHYTPKQLAHVLKSAGLQVERTYAAGFPFFNLFRLGVLLRGKHVEEDVSGTPGLAIRVLSKVFDVLLPLSLNRWGWQTIAVARYPRSN